jgi:hypothetical protein
MDTQGLSHRDLLLAGSTALAPLAVLALEGHPRTGREITWALRL